MITIAITVYNRADYLPECLESVLRQTHRDIEVLCVDDASTDGSYSILQQYAARDNRIRLFRNAENSGAQTSRNLALKEAKGDYITFVDDDDWISLDCIEQCVKELAENPEVDTLCLGEIRVRTDGSQYKPLGRKDFDKISGRQAFLWSMPWQIGGCYVTRTALHRQCPFSNSCRAFGDENTGRLLLLSSRVVMQSKGLYYYRMLPVSVSHGINMGQFTRLHSQAVLAQELRDGQAVAMENTTEKGGGAVDKDLLEAYETFRWTYVINAYMYYFLHREQLSPSQRAEALRIIRDARHTIDFHLVPKSLSLKFGYVPFLFSWRLFRLQETLYFTIRKLLGSLKINENGDPREK